MGESAVHALRPASDPARAAPARVGRVPPAMTATSNPPAATATRARSTGRNPLPRASGAGHTTSANAASPPSRVMPGLSWPAMRVLIVRHAEAAPGTPDELRAITPTGLQQARTLGRKLREGGFSADAVVASPLLRARETAVALALAPPTVDERLAPGASPEDIR